MHASAFHDEEPLPGVTFVMPVLNEQEYLEQAVTAVLAQNYPADHELVLALGPSTDRTNDIAEQLARANSRVRLVSNPDRDIPIALNLAIGAARYPVIIRVDAHSQLSAGYAEQAVRTLRAQGAVNVGGVMSAAGTTRVQRSIAHAYNSPVGLGGGSYHTDGVPGPAESAYLGVFTRQAWQEVGGFDPVIRRGEDWEFNLRLRQSGGLIWFDPSLRVTYWPRSSFGALAKQFFATGSWRATIVRKYRSENPWRFFVPGLYVLSLLAVLIVGVLHFSGVVAASAWWPWLLYASPVLHTLLTGLAALRMTRRDPSANVLLCHAALIIMHVTWGTGFLVGLVTGSARIVDRSRA